MGTRIADIGKLNYLVDRKVADPNWEGYGKGTSTDARKAVYKEILEGFRSLQEAEEYIEGRPEDQVTSTARGDEIRFSMLRVVIDHVKKNKWYSPWAVQPHAAPMSVDVWYDRYTKSWVVQRKDGRGNQIGDADYVYTRREAEALKSQYLKKGQARTPMTSKKPFVRVGERVRYLLDRKVRYGDWAEGAWLTKGTTGTVVEYHEESPAVTIRGEYFEGIGPWAVVEWDIGKGSRTAIDPEDEGKDWKRI